jgi:hypothetical protein
MDWLAKNQKIAFAKKVVTDGFAINFHFARKRPSDEEVQSIQLVTACKIHERFQPGADRSRVYRCNQSATTCQKLTRKSW